MKKIKIVALALACILVFSGCSLVSRNEEAVAAQVVATVNGVEIIQGDVDTEAEMYASYYGLDYDSTDETELLQIEMLKQSILDSMIENELLLQHADELGVSLTQEEIDENKTEAEEMLVSIEDSMRESVEAEAEEDESIDVEAETASLVEEYLEEANFSVEEYAVSLNEQDIMEKVCEKVYEQAEVTEEDALAKYEELLEEQQTEMDEDPQEFETYVQNEEAYVYIPENFVAVKHVLLKIDDETLVEEATTLYSEGDEDAAMEMLEDEIDALMPSAEDVQQRLEDGEAIDELIAELGEDEGMTSGGAATYGYLISESTTTYLTEFMEAALSLDEIGDVSAPVATYYGLHVLQSIAEYEAGVIPYEDIQEQMLEEARPDKEYEEYDAQLAAWEEEAEIVQYEDRLMN